MSFLKQFVALTALGIASAFASQHTHGAIEQHEDALVRSIIPSTTVQKVRRAEMDGLYKAYLENEQILYVNPFKRLIFVGEIYSHNGQNITEADRTIWSNEIKAAQLGELKKEVLTEHSMVEVFGAGGKKYEFVIFTDPECPFCKKAEEHLSKHDATLHINFLPLPFHKNAKAWSLQAMSSKDFKTALSKIHKSGKGLDVKISGEAEEKLEKMMALAERLGIAGTPKIFVVEKEGHGVVEIIDGANIPKIDEFLKKDKQ